MAPALPVVSADEAVRTFERLGYRVVRQRGSHIRLRHPSDPQRPPLTVPNHRQLKVGLLRGLIRTANLSVEEFVELLNDS